MIEKKRYEYDFSKLKGKIIEKFNNRKMFAEKMGLSEASIYDKLNNKTEFKQSDIFNACKLLEIKDDEIKSYFFSIIS